VLSLSATSWPINVRDGQPVRLLIRGRRHEATATVYGGPDEVAALFAQFVERHGHKAARGLLL